MYQYLALWDDGRAEVFEAKNNRDAWRIIREKYSSSDALKKLQRIDELKEVRPPKTKSKKKELSFAELKIAYRKLDGAYKKLENEHKKSQDHYCSPTPSMTDEERLQREIDQDLAWK